MSFSFSAMMAFIAFGLIFSGMSFFINSKQTTDPSWQKTMGIISSYTSSKSVATKGRTVYAPVVEYTVGGQNFIRTSNIETSDVPRIREAKEVAYNPNSPIESKVITDKTTTRVFMVIGLAFVVLGPILYFKR